MKYDDRIASSSAIFAAQPYMAFALVRAMP
jgi:hypothetical protein